MSTICSPFKLTPPPAKKGLPSIGNVVSFVKYLRQNGFVFQLQREGQLLFLPWINGRMKFTENLLTNIQLSKMLHLEIPNITKAVTKHLPVSKTCQHVPTLNPHVRLQHHAIRIHHQMKIISLLWHDLELPKSIG